MITGGDGVYNMRQAVISDSSSIREDAYANQYIFLPAGRKTAAAEDACWEECTRVRFTDVSINRIIAAAHIPRGSFYQYFTDKEDMIRYLLKGVREYFIQSLRDILHTHEGDLLSLPLGAFDRLVQQRGVADPVLARFIQVLQPQSGDRDPELFDRTTGIDARTFMG